ncbi:MAG: glycosyltransferase family 2 protein [bacterium]|nr:glycosyltransferase family 2 protein [bacterium]
MAKLSVHLVAWNGARYMPYLFESLRKQTCKDWELLAIDNNSTKDNTADLIEKEIKDFPVPARLIRNKENNGFSGGHNQCVKSIVSSSESIEYIQLLNQDMYLAPDYFEKVVAMMDAHPEAGAGQGLLLKWDFSKFPIPNSQFPIEDTLTNTVDTMGLKVLRSRRVVDFETGKILSTIDYSLSTPLEVFGVSGALPIYRREAIEEVSFEGAMFDDEFGSYKEDVDLAFRLRSAGWKAYVAFGARAWHDRTAAGPREMSDSAALKNRKGRAAYLNFYSYRNHLVVLLKNEHRANFMHDWPWIMLYELKKFLYLLFTDWATLKGLNDVRKLWGRTMEKRSAIMKNYKVKPQEMRKWYF